MSEYKVEWTNEQWFRVTIEADSQEEAMDKFSMGEYENEQMFGSEMQNSVEIRMLDDELEES